MSYDYSENILVQESAGNLLRDELGWDVRFAYNTEILGKNGTFGRESYKEIVLLRYFREALKKLNPWINDNQILEAQKTLEQRLSTSSLLQVNEEKYFLICWLALLYEGSHRRGYFTPPRATSMALPK